MTPTGEPPRAPADTLAPAGGDGELTPEAAQASPPGPPAKPKKKKKKKRVSVFNVILVLIFLVGLGVVAYPSVSDWWNSMHSSQAIAGYVQSVEDLSAEERARMLDEALAYNASLAPGVHMTLTDAEMQEYLKQLDVTGTGIMGYIQIPSIDVSLPIYHTTEETVLQIAIGHIPGTSLPVGGETCHTVLSGHRGLPSARLLTDLDRLVVGDLFTMTTLDQTVTYVVDQIRIVLPEQVEDLAIETGKDYCTLVTCTPYGVNSHRILVRGHRTENALEDVIITAEAVRIPNYIVIPAVGAPLLFLMLLIMLLVTGRRKKKKSHRELLDEFKQR